MNATLLYRFIRSGRRLSLTTIVATFVAATVVAALASTAAGLQTRPNRGTVPPGHRLVAALPELHGDQNERLPLPVDPVLDHSVVSEVIRVWGSHAKPVHRMPVTLSLGDNALATVAIDQVSPDQQVAQGQVALGSRVAESFGSNSSVRLHLCGSDSCGSYQLNVISGPADLDPDQVLVNRQDMAAWAPTAPVVRVWGPDQDLPDLAGNPMPRVLTEGQQVPGPTDADADSARVLLIMMAVIALMVTLVLLLGVQGISVARRSVHLAQLRLSGALEWQVRTLLLAEAAITTIPAALAGAISGSMLIGVMGEVLRTMALLPTDVTIRWALWPSLACTILFALMGCAASWFAGRRVSRISPMQALVEESLPERGGMAVRRVAGFLALAACLAMMTALPTLSTEQVANVALVISFTLLAVLAFLGPDINALLMRLLGPLMRLSQGILGTGGSSISRNHRRSARLTQPVTIGVALSIVLLGTGTILDSSAANTSRMHLGDVTITSPGLLPQPALANSVCPHVAGCRLVTPTLLTMNRNGRAGLKTYRASGVRASGSTPEIPGDGEVRLTQETAAELGVTVGDQIQAWSPDGRELSVRVSGITSTLPGSAAAMVSAKDLPHDLVPMGAQRLDLWTSGRYTTVPEYLKQIQWPLVALSSEAWAAQEAGRAQRDVRAIWALAGFCLALGLFGVTVTAMMDASGRRREFVALRLSGATATQIRSFLAVEGLVTSMIGAVLGAAVSTLSLLLVARAMPGTPSVETRILLLVPLEAVAAAGVCYASSWRAARLDIQRLGGRD